MAEIEDLLEDAVNGLEDLAKVISLAASAPREMPAPVVHVDAPMASVTPPAVNVHPEIVVRDDKRAVRIRVVERDMAGKIAEMEVTPI